METGLIVRKSVGEREKGACWGKWERQGWSVHEKIWSMREVGRWGVGTVCLGECSAFGYVWSPPPFLKQGELGVGPEVCEDG